MHFEVLAGKILHMGGLYVRNQHWSFCLWMCCMGRLLKDSYQQIDRQVKSSLSTLIMAQSSCFLDSLTLLYLLSNRPWSNQESSRMDKSLCEAGGLLPGDWLVSELNVISCQGREKVNLFYKKMSLYLFFTVSSISKI